MPRIKGSQKYRTYKGRSVGSRTTAVMKRMIPKRSGITKFSSGVPHAPDRLFGPRT